MKIITHIRIVDIQVKKNPMGENKVQKSVSS